MPKTNGSQQDKRLLETEHLEIFHDRVQRHVLATTGEVIYVKNKVLAFRIKEGWLDIIVGGSKVGSIPFEEDFCEDIAAMGISLLTEKRKRMKEVEAAKKMAERYS